MDYNFKSDLCPICRQGLNYPVECINCKNFFCLECAKKNKEKLNKKQKENNDDEKKDISSCPLCQSSPFLYQENKAFIQVIKDRVYQCKICKEDFTYNEYIKHKEICKIYNCGFCKKICNGEKDLLYHFSSNIYHREYIINIMNLSKKVSEEKIFLLTLRSQENQLNHNEILIDIIKRKKNKEKNSSLFFKSKNKNIEYNFNNEENEVKKKKNNNSVKFQNIIYQLKLESNKKKMLKNSSNHVNIFNNIPEKLNFDIIKNLPLNLKYDIESDLIYCFKDSKLDCECCKDHICKPGNCLCKNCMNKNKKYHCIKEYYLINKEGRVAKYINQTFQCYYFFTETYQYNNNTYIKKMRCNYLNTCKACKELTLLIGKYFPQKLIERLRILK